MSQSSNGTVRVVHEEAGLNYHRCRWCGTASFRRLLCPVCASSDLKAEHSDGLGVVVRSGVVHRYTEAARNESLVRLPEGFVFRCRVVGAAPHRVTVGARVRPVAVEGPDSGEVVFELCDPPREDWL